MEFQELLPMVHSLVWKFRNIGYVDSMYGPVLNNSQEAKSEQKMERLEKPSIKVSARHFEDLVGEAHLVYMTLIQDVQTGKADGDFKAMFRVRFHDHLVNLHRHTRKYGLVDHLDDEQMERFPEPEREEQLCPENLKGDKRLVAIAILSKDPELIECTWHKGPHKDTINKEAVTKFLRRKWKWDWERIKAFWRSCSQEPVET